jgi:Gamma-glutamyl cyclotransferase, AIG2-like
MEQQNLFTYGTLQLEEVQLATFGRRLEGRLDVLIGYRLAMITIEDEDFVAKSGTAEHRNLQFTGNDSDFVDGTVFSVTMEELHRSDAYEPEGYERVLVQLQSRTNAWIYLNGHQSL